MPKISFLGMGYVGLCTAMCFANRGFKTTVSTKDPEKTLKTKKLTAIVGRKQAILEKDISYITVGTPSQRDGSFDLRFVEETSREKGSLHTCLW